MLPTERRRENSQQFITDEENRCYSPWIVDSILEKIGVNPALRQNLNSHNIGAVMSRLGFKKIHKEHGNGWAVIEKEGCEINSDAVIDPNDTMED